jgi:NAD(P)-dependent dehydrogenase (short-subunit alcohol dehydrogenase family)
MSKVILITGTSSGFGKDTAETLARAGHTVYATMRGITGKHAAHANELEAKGIPVLEMDVQNDTSVEAAFEALFQRTGGKLDILVNNAGFMVQGISESITTEHTSQMFDVNVIGIQRVLRAALPQLRKNGSGLVINVGSILGRVTIPFMSLYGATKFAVEALTEGYRYELSQLGIDVVLVQPGAYPTGLYGHLNGGEADRTKAYGEVSNAQDGLLQIMQGMFGGAEPPNPHDVAEAIARLAATPAGQRPERVVVGNGFGADAVNAAVRPIQSSMIGGLGMSGLEKLRIA